MFDSGGASLSSYSWWLVGSLLFRSFIGWFDAAPFIPWLVRCCSVRSLVGIAAATCIHWLVRCWSVRSLVGCCCSTRSLVGSLLFRSFIGGWVLAIPCVHWFVRCWFIAVSFKNHWLIHSCRLCFFFSTFVLSRVRWGLSLELFILDTRQYRSLPTDNDTAANPKTMLGETQVQTSSRCTFGGVAIRQRLPSNYLGVEIWRCPNPTAPALLTKHIVSLKNNYINSHY